MIIKAIEEDEEFKEEVSFANFNELSLDILQLKRGSVARMV